MKGTRVAPRFAKALLDLAVEEKSADKVAVDMRLLSGTIDESKDLKLLLESPIVKGDKKNDVINAVFSGKISEMSQKFLNLLVSKGRENAIPAIAESYLHFYREQNGVVKAEIISASKMDAKNKEAVVAKIKTATGAKEVEVEEKIDSELIGGLIVRLNDKQLDLSVAGQLASIRKQILN